MKVKLSELRSIIQQQLKTSGSVNRIREPKLREMVRDIIKEFGAGGIVGDVNSKEFEKDDPIEVVVPVEDDNIDPTAEKSKSKWLMGLWGSTSFFTKFEEITGKMSKDEKVDLMRTIMQKAGISDSIDLVNLFPRLKHSFTKNESKNISEVDKKVDNDKKALSQLSAKMKELINFGIDGKKIQTNYVEAYYELSKAIMDRFIYSEVNAIIKVANILNVHL